MKINPKLEAALNRQINLEWQVSYGFLAMAAWFETTPFKGFAKWMLLRSEREQAHAIELFEYLRNRFGELDLREIEEPQKTFGSPLESFERALELKREVTGATHKLYELSLKEKELETQELLLHFLKEQVHEEKHIQDITEKVELANGHPDALIHLDYKEELQYKGKGE
jgi:ferritin